MIASAIILPEQNLASEKAGLAVSKKGLTLKELLQQTSHHNAKVRRSRDEHGPVRYQTGTEKRVKWVPVPVTNIPVRYGTGTYRYFTRKYRYRYRTTEKVVTGTGTEYTRYCSVPVPGTKCPSVRRGNIGLAPFGLSTCKRPDDCSLLYELPESFKTPSLHVIPTNDLICQEGKPEAVVDPWTNYDETYNDKILNLQLNPERYSSYSGPSARRVWDAVYSQLCPEYSSGNSCPEKKVLYRLMSGLHSSISVHIATDYLLDEKTNQVFLAWIQLHKTACYRLSCDTFV
ncbi:putative endoplasmic reticulum oxidoreductin 1, ERO1-like superfamily [Helianthus annuus]|nr:putative endoplasmic reticulum oxidoreductin 1, ERO1-like superfamily [Helianthus annuus]KAJ0659521.1 putative endoplasmic reticulum oxidoreductin 1, ERO1-like superfamily [Helianthus annuus]KAJ0853195.1 putative endoplasmic reticulum oxidoreductin 1, ERO1-like superfamily [Helianthus annuus]